MNRTVISAIESDKPTGYAAAAPHCGKTILSLPDHGLEPRATRASRAAKAGRLPPAAVAIPIMTMASMFAPFFASTSSVVVPIAPVVAGAVILHHRHVRTHIFSRRRRCRKAQQESASQAQKLMSSHDSCLLPWPSAKQVPMKRTSTTSCLSGFKAR